MAVLQAERLIEAQRMPQLRRRAGRCAFTKHLLHRIAWHNVNHQKDEREHQPQGGQGEQKSLEEMAEHRKRNYDRETVDFAAFRGEVSDWLFFLPSAEVTRSIFTRATRLPSISAIVKRKSPWTKLSPPLGMNPS